MQVIQLGPFPPPYGGVQANLMAIRDYLRSQGIRSGVINLTRYRQAPVDGVFFPRNAVETARLLTGLPCRILHLHIGGNVQLRMAILGLLCSWMPGRKSILTFHSGGFPVSPRGKAAKPASLLGFVFRQFDRIIVVNAQLGDLFRRYGVQPERIRLILPHAVDPNEMAPQLPPALESFYRAHGPVLLSVSGLEPEYDLNLQIEAMDSIRARFPRAGLAILGSGSIEAELRARIASKPYRDHVLLAGDVPHSVTLRAIRDADLCLRTTLYDGDAVSVREAICLGAPIIATDNGMRPPGVRLIPIADREALVRAVVEELSSERTAAGPAVITGRENIEAVLDLYRELAPDAFRSAG